ASAHRKRAASMKRPSLRASLFLSLALIGLPVFGQVTATGSLAGRVIDKSGGVINGGTVKLTNTGSGLQGQAQTGNEGLYQFELLPAGSYEVAVEMTGFAKVSVHAVEVEVGKATTVNVTLEPGKLTDVVTVEGQSIPLVDVTRTDVSLAVTPDQVREM